jgi:hypothetical protein
MTLCPPIFYAHITVLDIANLREALLKCSDEVRKRSR